MGSEDCTKDDSEVQKTVGKEEDAGCVGNYCELCKFLKEIRAKKNLEWMGDWKRELSEWKYLDRHTLQASHVQFAAFNIDDKIWRIREKLSSLQTTTPAWAFLHRIADRAQFRAMKYTRRLQIMKVKNRKLDPHGVISIPHLETIVSHDDLKPIISLDVVKEASSLASEILQKVASLSTPIDGTPIDSRETHITPSENILSDDSDEGAPDESFAESSLPKDAKVAMDLRFITNALYVRSTAVRLAERSVVEYSIQCRAKLTKFVEDHVFFMLKVLYDDLRPLDILHDKHDKTNEPLEKKVLRQFQRFGPVGERPLHVCSLVAAKFSSGHLFEGGTSYMTEGIVEGMKKFLQKEQMWKEIYVPYEKDYCAAVGDLLFHAVGSELVNIKNLSFLEKTREFPYILDIAIWYAKHMGEVHGIRRWCAYCIPNEDHSKITTGLYEGESLLYPMISRADESTIRWLLDNNPHKKDVGYRPLTHFHAFGLFFQPMHKEWLTSRDLVKGWTMYRYNRNLECNLHASSPRSYFGLSAIAFAASQGNVRIFDLLFRDALAWLQDKINGILKEKEDPKLIKDTDQSPPSLKDLIDNWKETQKSRGCDKPEELDRNELLTVLKSQVEKAILNAQDEFGNTLLHLTAWNEKKEMYSKLIELGADSLIQNNDGLTPFTLTARFGIWGMYKHIWDRHLTSIVWMFGNVTATDVDYSQFDWRGLTAFSGREELLECMDALMRVIHSAKSDLERFRGKHQKDTKWRAQFKVLDDVLDKMLLKDIQEKIQVLLPDGVTGKVPKGQGEEEETPKELAGGCLAGTYRGGSDGSMSAIRLITVFRPKDWYVHTHEQVEEVIIDKWNKGYSLVHIGDSLLPYLFQLMLFGIMWSLRKLNTNEKSFWWADDPVSVPSRSGSPDSQCGVRAIMESRSGHLQLALAVYSVPSLLRLGYEQLRLRPSDLDEDENMVITFNELSDFFYFNLESMLHFVAAGLLLSIVTFRALAGEECDKDAQWMEKNTTSIAALILFFNLFMLGKPYKTVGLLVLTTYRFLTQELFSFIVMYCILFAGFVISLQTLHRSDHAFLEWMDTNDTIVPQVVAAQKLTYLVNQNILEDGDAENRLMSTFTQLSGCEQSRRSLYETAFSLLEVSMGDGLSDALLQARSFQFTCAGFTPDPLIGFIIVLWVFLTNILLLNMLIAMMNFLFAEQVLNNDSVWLLDVSNRVFRFERVFPELNPFIQRRTQRFSFWTKNFWLARGWDLLLILYCLPEVHLIGGPNRVYHIVRDWWKSRTYAKWNNSIELVQSHWSEVVKTVKSRSSAKKPRDDKSKGTKTFNEREWKKIAALARSRPVQIALEELKQVPPASKPTASIDSKKPPPLRDAELALVIVLIVRLAAFNDHYFESFKVYSAKVHND